MCPQIRGIPVECFSTRAARLELGARWVNWIMLAVGALISFLGVPAGLVGNELSIRYGLRNIGTLVFLLSAFTGGLFDLQRSCLTSPSYG